MVISSLRISDITKRELAKIAGMLQAKDGRIRSADEVVMFLIEQFKKG